MSHPANAFKAALARPQARMVPMVESAEQARTLVHAMRYPPQGVRGVGSGLARSSRWSLEADDLQAANEGMCLLVQAARALSRRFRSAHATVDAAASAATSGY